MTGTYLMDTGRLRALLGAEYANVIRFTTEEALEDTFSSHLDDRQPITNSASA
jgi:hypothetical protein